MAVLWQKQKFKLFKTSTTTTADSRCEMQTCVPLNFFLFESSFVFQIVESTQLLTQRRFRKVEANQFLTQTFFRKLIRINCWLKSCWFNSTLETILGNDNNMDKKCTYCVHKLLYCLFAAGSSSSQSMKAPCITLRRWAMPPTVTHDST